MGSRRLSRRKFLGILGGLAAVAGLSGILWQTLKPKEEQKPGREVRPNAYTQGGKSLVSIMRGSSNTGVETMVREAVDAIGGIQKVVSSGRTVVIKPAVLTSDPECAPNPAVVAAVVKLVKETGATAIVAESSGNGNTSFNLSRVGITSAAEAAGAEVKDLQTEDETTVEIPNGVTLNAVKTYPTICNCDALISVPRLKRHGSSTVTISLKNMMGTVPKSEMSRFHNQGLSQCIADLNTVVRPDLIVLDATAAMAGSGPTGGTMIEMHTIMASGDSVAIDTVGAQRLREVEQQRGIRTFDPADIKHISAAAALGVGTDDFGKMNIIERDIS